MVQPQLSIVPSPDAQTPAKPKFFYEISNGASLTEIYVYSQRDFAAGACAQEKSRQFDGNDRLLPVYDDKNLVDLGGSFTKEQLAAALKKMKTGEAPEITKLRRTIVEAVELKKLFVTAVRTAEDANEHGISFIDDNISNKPIPLGIMAFEH